jgi:hypothetical protein
MMIRGFESCQVRSGVFLGSLKLRCDAPKTGDPQVRNNRAFPLSSRQFLPLLSALMSIRILLAALFLALPTLRAAVPQESASPGEHVIVSGGVSLWMWEKWKAQPHDNWWANFVRAARIRIEQIRAAKPDAQITWLVYRPAYVSRGRQDKRDYLSLITSVRDAFKVRLMWFENADQLVNYLNIGQPRDSVKICNLEFFGHSNKACFMFDYSNQIDSGSKVWLHEKEFGKIRRGIFTRDALVRSWGCHTGESMSQRFRSATGVPMWGLIGKSQYLTEELPVPSTLTGRWVR